MSRAERYLAIDGLLSLATVLVASSDDLAASAGSAQADAMPPALPPTALAEALKATWLGRLDSPPDDARATNGTAAARAPVSPSDQVMPPPPELELATGVLHALADGRRSAALSQLSALLEAPLHASELEARLEELGARLASALGDERLALRFLERRAAYRRRYLPGHAVDLVAGLVADPEWLGDLAAMLGADPDEWMSEAGLDARSASRPYASSPPEDHPAGGFVPLAREPEAPAGDGGGRPGSASSGDDLDGKGRDGAMAYLVTLRHLDDARTASFSAHRIGWHELDSGLDGISDLVLSFERGAERLLRQVDPEALSLRLFFGEGSGYDEFSTASGSLFDVEANPAELRVYLKLRRPAAWSATGLPPAELWRQLSSCVLITEPG